jgi:hypothetical protein
MEQKFQLQVSVDFRESSMQAAIDRVMQTYGLLVNLTADQEQVAREKSLKFPGQCPYGRRKQTGGRGPSLFAGFFRERG